jgi:hypothetical protein
LQVFSIPKSEDVLTIQGGCVQRLSADLHQVWQSRPFGAHWINTVTDLDGDGRLEILTSNGRDVVILSADTGVLLFSLDITRDANGSVQSYGTYATMFQVAKLLADSSGQQIVVPCFSHKEVLLLDCSGDVRRTHVHRALYMEDAYHPTIALGDVNQDGQDEIVIARLGGVYVFDPVSGRMLTQTQWSTDDTRRRNYGHLELVDFNGDGHLEAVIISDRVTRHVAALGNNGSGEFYPMWDRFVEHIYPNDSTELKYCYNSLGKFRDEGGIQLALSLYNYRGSEQWTTEVIDLVSGLTVWEVADHVLCGAEDIDEDGTLELLLKPSTSRVPVERAGAVAVRADKSQELWRREHATFAQRTLQYRGTKGQFKPDPFSNDTCWLSRSTGQLEVLVLEERGSLCGINASGQQRIILEGVGLNSRVVRCEGGQFTLTSNNGELWSALRGNILRQPNTGYQLLTEAHLSARPGFLPTVASTAEGSTVVIPHEDHARVYTVRDGQIHERCRIEGRGKRAYDNVVVAFPIFETSYGTRIFASTNVDDQAGVSLYTLAGALDRVIKLSGYPANSSGSRIGVYDMQYFEHSRGPAVYAAVYRSHSMNSECSLAVLIETGELLWQVERLGDGEFGRGIGPWSLSTLAEIQGRQVVMFCAKDTLVALDLETGAFVSPPVLLTELTADVMRREGRLKEQDFSTWSTIDDPFTAYGSVIAIDLNADGKQEFIVAGCFGGFGVLDNSLKPIWWKVTPFNDVQYRLPAIGDFNGDGVLELVQGHQNGELTVYNTMTGESLASLGMLGISTDLVSSDIDGCGIEEVIGSTDTGQLFILKLTSTGLLIHKEWYFQSGLGSPIVVDVDIDGINEILAVDGLGALHVLKHDA